MFAVLSGERSELDNVAQLSSTYLRAAWPRERGGGMGAEARGRVTGNGAAPIGGRDGGDGE